MKGFQIFYEGIKPQFKSQLDVVVSVVHFMLINDDFICVGTGEEFVEGDANGGSELMPNDWNSNQHVYSLKYRSRNSDKLNLLLKGIVAGDLFIISLLPINKSSTVHSVSIKTSQFVTTDLTANYPNVFVGSDIKPLETLLKKELFDKLREQPQAGKAATSGQQQQQQQEPGSSLLEQVYVPPRPNYGQQNPYADPLGPPMFPQIGGADLDPFNRGGGGGMLYDPFHQGGVNPLRGDPKRDPNFPLPPGAIPPGARYDPIGPPKGPTKDNRNPNPDHFGPPGGYDPFI